MRTLRTILVALGLTVLLGALWLDAASAHDGKSDEMLLDPDGHLIVTGDGFLPNENLVLRVETSSGGGRRLTVRADFQGNFFLPTDLSARPGESVRLDARGDQGSARTTFSSVISPKPWYMVDLEWLLAGGLGIGVA